MPTPAQLKPAARTRHSVERLVRLRVFRPIWGLEWGFERGRLLHGKRDADGTWTVWPPKRPEAYITAVPRWMLRRAEPTRKRKPNAGAEGRREPLPTKPGA